MAQTLHSSHSADIEAWLDCGEHGCVPLSRITPTLAVAKAARDIPPCFADLVITVDGRALRNRVNLPSGFRNGRRAARMVTVDDVAPF
jgi:hypothetical protein